MKTIVKVAAMFASALVVLSSCVKEQSGFSIEDIPGTAKVMGVITYNEGQAYQNGAFVDLKSPAANLEIVVKVANDGLSPNDAEGYTDYKVTTDAKGAYEVVIPATENNMEVIVLAPSYQGVYKSLKRGFAFDGDDPVFSEKEVLYSFEKTDYVSAGRIVVIGGEYQKEEITEGYAKTQELYFSVYVQAPVAKQYSRDVTDDYYFSQYDADYYAGEFKGLSDVQLEISVSADFDGDGRSESQIFSGVTDFDGYADIAFYAHTINLSDVYVEVKARETESDAAFNFYTWVRKEYYDSYYGSTTYRWSQERNAIPASYYYYRPYNSSVSSSLSFGALRIPVVKVTMEPALFTADIPQDEKNEENGWYQKWSSVDYLYNDIWFY